MLGDNTAIPHNLYLWTCRVFNWRQDQYSIYYTINQLIGQLIVLAAASILHRLEIHDCLMGASSELLVFLRNLTFGLLTLASQWWVVYMFVIVPDQLPTAIIRSQISKLCDSDEIGRYMSLLAILEVLWPVVDSAIFTAVYTSTLSFYPSYEHLVGAIFSLYVFSGFLGLKLSLASEEGRSTAQSSFQTNVTLNYKKDNSSTVDVQNASQISISGNENISE
ncbi:uncharacterized protein LOC121855522 [Homarus americanus]|uniref:uncharacterized protein LOC121855522 n=1 Tax=Homarus americanus TaxID=6706 RepID=UPI001C49571B|nr:uncharacterized protein LOC121855522 [Homarus americanus]